MEVARQEVAVRICSCPGRDVKNEEDRLRKKTHLEPQSNDEDQRYGEPRFDRVSLSINLGENPNGLHGVVPDRFSMVVGHGDVILFFFLLILERGLRQGSVHSRLGHGRGRRVPRHVASESLNRRQTRFCYR